MAKNPFGDSPLQQNPFGDTPVIQPSPFEKKEKVGFARNLFRTLGGAARDVTQANEEGEPQAAIDSLPPEQQPNFADGNLLTDPQLNQTAMLQKALSGGGNNQIVNSTNVTNNNFNQYQEFKAIPDQNPLSEYAQLYAV